MARTGLNNGFYFDPEVFADYMQEQSVINTRIIESGILVHDPEIQRMVGTSNNVGTIPFFLSADNETDALNDDGETNNTPTTLTGSKQTFMAMARMKAWQENTFVRYLTGESPLQNLANNLVVPYYTNQWQSDLLAILTGITEVTGMEDHKTDIASTSGTVTDDNKLSLTTHIDAGQKALGDRRANLTLFICHSAVLANLKKQELITYRAFTDANAIQSDNIPMFGNMIVIETDNGTVDASGAVPVYTSYMIGRGAFLAADKQVHMPYNVEYDPETNGGVEKLYTKQAKVFHPNGFSIQADNIVKESPTRAELATTANWELKFNHKNIPIVKIVSNG